MFRQSFSLFLHLSEEPREVHADDVLKSEKALRYYSYLRNRQFQIHGNDRQQCLRSIVYPFAKKVYISIERGLLFNYPCSRCLAIPYTFVYNNLIYKTKSPLVKKAGNNSVTKRLFIASGGLFWYKYRQILKTIIPSAKYIADGNTLIPI